MSDLADVTSSAFEKENRDKIEVWRFEFEDGRVQYEKEIHIHSSTYLHFTEEIDEEEHNKTLKKLVNSEKWEEIE